MVFNVVFHFYTFDKLKTCPVNTQKELVPTSTVISSFYFIHWSDLFRILCWGNC